MIRVALFVLSLLLRVDFTQESVKTDPNDETMNLERVIEELRLKLNPIGFYEDKLVGQLKGGLLKLAPKVYNIYLIENNLKYSPEEQKLRYKIFENALKKVLFENNGSWKKGINKFSDKSEVEREAYLGYNRSRPLSSEVSGTGKPGMVGTSMIVGSRSSLGWPLYPTSKTVDWRKRGAMTIPLDQEDCGICWAFASTSVLESLYFIKTGVLRTMSVQQVADCTYSTNGCVGGWFGDVYSYLMNSNKLASSNSYPLELPKKGAGFTINRGCDYKKLKISKDAIKVAYLSQYESGVTEESIIGALSRQPLTAGMHSPHSLFSYKSGLFLEKNCPSSMETNNHAVVLAGYSSSTFLVKNSWGESWGEKGYFRLKRVGYNCGVTTDVVWPTLHTYQERDPDSSYTPCKDKQPWCRNFAVTACPVSAPFRETCPYSCSVCSCRDLAEGCPHKLHQCSTHSSVRWACRRSCELCHCPPGTSLCRTQCVPYWHQGYKPRQCDNKPPKNSEFED